ADDRQDLRGVAPRDALQLSLRVCARVNGGTALRAAVGNVDERALPRHPHGERAHLAEVHVRRAAQSAFGGTAGEVVLDSVAEVDGGAAVLSAQRDADRHLAAWRAQHLVSAVVVAKVLDGSGKLRVCIGEGTLTD